ncbi:hypothetical protein AHMF7605_09150 [Adhaeribacter arboris]|uniref:DUF6984 domain-containing protein n=1 Tax=Adhaeribacter arboris TaxID=2072846 RepID=A0A2T2YDT5_9BACT|nr:hypothetical protein [Adhaeribacter arboris]PSR53679.1 hypothetical protein AHMF7605_09150 [Adhaeribacter arboris]
MTKRPIKEQELNLVKHLLQLTSKLNFDLTKFTTVIELEDGGMGSIRFINNKPARVYGTDLVQVEYIDEDKVPVLITVTIGNHQELFELEFWKVDFGKLLRNPNPSEITIKN